MGGSAKVPQPTAEERELQKNQSDMLKLQTEILRQQRAQQAILLPFLAEQEGFQVETDKDGNVTKISKTPSELENMRKDLETQLTRRSLDALAGNLPVSPGLERDLTKTEQTLRQRLSNQLGSGYETSTPGIEALAKNKESADVLREGARTAQLTLAEQLGMAREQQNNASRFDSTNQGLGSATGVPFALQGAFGQNAAGYGKAQEPFIAQRQMQLQASIANQQARGQMFGAGIGLIGGLFSDVRLKTDIQQISELCPGIGIYTFRYNDTVEGLGDETRIGVLADEVEQIFPEAVGERDGYKTVDTTLLSNLVKMSRANMAFAQ